MFEAVFDYGNAGFKWVRPRFFILMNDSSILNAVVLHSSTPSINAGDKITRGKYGSALGGRGTAGLIVRRRSASTGAYVLTCAHVLGTPAVDPATAVNDNLVYSPEFSDSSGIECNKPFGQVVSETLQRRPDQVAQAQMKFGAETFVVDAALIEIVPGADARNDIPKIGKIAGTRDLIAEWALTSIQATPVALPPARQIAVRKYGITTKYTEGKLRGLVRQKVLEFGDGPTPAVESQGLVLEIEAGPGQAPIEDEYELDMSRFAADIEGITKPEDVKALFDGTGVTATLGGSLKARTLKIVSRSFSQPGDSGSPVVDENNRIVGILTSGKSIRIFVKGQDAPVDIHTENSQAIFIQAALDKLQVDFLPAGQHTAGTPIIVPGRAIERSSQEPMDWTALDDARAAFEGNPAGARLATLVRRHVEEVRQLVHHRRRVTVTWHRSKGPGFLVAIVRSARLSGWPIPIEIDGVRLIDALRAMRNVLMAEGSPALRAAIAEHEGEILGLAEDATSVDEVLKALANRTEFDA